MAVVRQGRYEYANQFVDELGRKFLDVPDPTPKSVLLRGAARREVTESDTLWSLAWLAYEPLLNIEEDLRPTSFFDVIGVCNGIVDPVAKLPRGRIFFLPTIEVLLGDVRVPPAFTADNVASVRSS